MALICQALLHTHQTMANVARATVALDRKEEAQPTEWWGDWDDSCRDVHGDDSISILIRKSGGIVVDQDPVDNPAKGC